MSSTHNHCFSHHHYQTWCHQIFFVNNTKIFVTPSVFKLQKWFLYQNGVESNQESKSDDSGPLYNVTERCEAVREVPKVLLKMASGLISPSGHRGQLCTVRTSSHCLDSDSDTNHSHNTAASATSNGQTWSCPQLLRQIIQPS